MIARLLLGGGGVIIGTLIFGPAGGSAGWKLGGFAATGNPLHLIPGGSTVADGTELIAELGGGSDIGGIDQTGPRTKGGW